jgi:hypothetical protein
MKTFILEWVLKTQSKICTVFLGVYAWTLQYVKISDDPDLKCVNFLHEFGDCGRRRGYEKEAGATRFESVAGSLKEDIWSAGLSYCQPSTHDYTL